MVAKATQLGVVVVAVTLAIFTSLAVSTTAQEPTELIIGDTVASAGVNFG